MHLSIFPQNGGGGGGSGGGGGGEHTLGIRQVGN